MSKVRAVGKNKKKRKQRVKPENLFARDLKTITLEQVNFGDTTGNSDTAFHDLLVKWLITRKKAVEPPMLIIEDSSIRDDWVGELEEVTAVEWDHDEGGEAVSEAEFARLVDGLEDSLSGSASSSEDTDSDESDAVRDLLQKTKIASRSPSPSSTDRVIPQKPVIWFQCPPSTQIGVYRSIFPLPSSASTYVDDLKSMQKGVEEGRKWAMFMVAGGHFAGLVVRVSKPDTDGEEPSDGTKKRKQKKPKPDTDVLMHKTFHRYTTRRKQGGSQSLNDNAKGYAKSAGAQLRRYGEQALRDDIRNLLQDWAEEIDQCERIWIRASASNRRIFLDYDGAIITKGDERLRTFPFPTRRPTQSELVRCLTELTKVKVSHLTEEALRAQDEAYLASLPKPKPKIQPAPTPQQPEKQPEPQLSKEEEILRDKWARLLDMVHRGRLDALKTLWEREHANLGGIDTTIPDWAGERYRTLLQLASHLNQEEVVNWLLEDAHADPTVPVPSTAPIDKAPDEDEYTSDAALAHLGSHRTAYDLAHSRAVRDVFRRAAGAHPDWWDWLGAGHVPSILSKEMEEGREERKKTRWKGLKDKVREREAREKERIKESPIEEEVEVVPKPAEESRTGPRKLGGGSGAAEGVAGLTPEMRAKIERERRARAAEARLKALGGR
ncbi:hypothetical protein EWM64_g4947 [Hericium alpestre]|uniref:VLRF1 domain-containing protein n=1 Tax=Hericium alpestre TaxID=135208 RepID=A0A4Z0A039_9AGAM|nr:hypothetical protein EWM64_g4947 [Hericium alpestre]